MKWFCMLLCFCGICVSASAQVLSGKVTNTDGKALVEAAILLTPTNAYVDTDAQGQFSFSKLDTGRYKLSIFKEGFQSIERIIHIKKKTQQINIVLNAIELDIKDLTVFAEDLNFGRRRLRAVEGVAIYAGKKAEVIDLEQLVANLSNNNSREVYAKISGLNIWENDGSGVQLNIGGRGLSPNRTANFNTRQNGYDISADALGYPESYYTPPTQALQQIQVVRGAASLQYGTQFGGMLNFVFKEGPKDKSVEFISENTLGSFGFLNSFNSLGGQLGKVNYYGFYQHKTGNGWRENSDFDVQTGYASMRWQLSKKLSLRAEYTHMSYLGQQPGGLTDREFQSQPRRSKRERNWFKLNWNIAALHADYQINDNAKINWRTFGLFAQRQALGNLQAINRVDYGAPRDLIKGEYKNIGSEIRYLQHYTLFNNPSVGLLGARVYRGFAAQAQGLSNEASTGTKSDFKFREPEAILASDYSFPSTNIALFAENFYPIGKHFSLTPGVRYEYIKTSAEGYYQDLLVVQGTSGLDTLKNDAIQETRSRGRSIFLAGIGASFKPHDKLEIYANYSQNYRAINFNDMRIVNPNAGVDPELQDERGFNMDLGLRGSWKNRINFDATLFYLSYRQRIGTIQERRQNPDNPALIEPFSLRTNVGDARIFGLESLIEANLLRWWKKSNPKTNLVAFVNFAVQNGRYLQTANSFAAGNQVELVPPMTIKTGLSLYAGNFRASAQYAYTKAHYTDATNAEFTANAVHGKIPSYGVADVSAGYEWKMLRLQIGCNNLFNQMYFTRRAASYPGPGIISAEGRSIYATLRLKLSK